MEESPTPVPEPASATATPTVPPPLPEPPPRRYGAWLLGLVLLTALGTGGYLLFELRRELAALRDDHARLDRELDAVQGRTEHLETRQADLAAINQRTDAQIATFAHRIDEYDQVVGRLNEDVAGGPQRVKLVAVEQLLLLANDRVQLAHDAASALAALEAADQRLGALNDPRLFKLREALARERAALAAVPQADVAAASLTLSTLIDRVPRLPLIARVPERFEAAPATEEPLPADAGWWARAATAVRRALAGTFAVRRNRGAVPQLLPAEAEALAFNVLVLKLEAARVALLRADTQGLRTACDSAQRWLAEYFRKDDPGVLAAQAQLERLQELELDPPLPDLTRSLGLLRAALEPPAQ